MKIGIFTDSHYSSRELSCGCRYNSRSLRKIREAYELFDREGCALAICLGDLIDTEGDRAKELENLGAVAEIMRKSDTPTLCLMGNHDGFSVGHEAFYSTLGLDEPSELTVEGRRLIFLDACYFSDGRRYASGDSDWTDCYLPDAESLAERLTGELDTYVFMHQNIDPEISEDHRLSNWDKVMEAILSSGNVRKVFQGHYHPGHVSRHGGVDFVTLPAMCEREGAYFVFEI